MLSLDAVIPISPPFFYINSMSESFPSVDDSLHLFMVFISPPLLFAIRYIVHGFFIYLFIIFF